MVWRFGGSALRMVLAVVAMNLSRTLAGLPGSKFDRNRVVLTARGAKRSRLAERGCRDHVVGLLDPLNARMT